MTPPVDRWSLHLGDSLPWLQTLQGDSVDMLLVDPPYSSGGLHRSDRNKVTTEKYIRTESQENRNYAEFFGDNRDQMSFLLWCSIWMAECHRILKTGAVVAVFSDWRQVGLMANAIQVGGFVWRGLIAWDKGEGSRPAGPGYPRHQCEYVIWGSKGPLPVRPAGTGLTIPGCLSFSPPTDKGHPTEKPLALYTELLKIGKPGGLVLDPFVGSGASAVASIRAGFRFLGAEMSPHYHAQACSWLRAEESNLGNRDEARGQLPLLGAE